ncbi:TPA: DEAD/DEAH box helicase [Candidatus Woesearchaeota archaeon]|nr:DEAD/DEAH box helicase [Candidatus Woesearchaeota archaeon]HIG93439.1 DEAD/DEAH box helicase [Candidatus Woesearchaeota archaeon]
MHYKNFTLDPFQEEAINAIDKNYSVVVSAPTGSGKTLIADFIIEKHKDDPVRIIYTAPIKALSNQKYKDFSKEYGADKIGLMTGDMVINPNAKILIMTTEIYRNMAISKDDDLKDIAYVIFDEIHYINDVERGYVWEESVIYSNEKVRFLCLSATIPNAQEFSNWIQAIKKHPVKTITSTKRSVPLEHWFYDYELGIATLEKIKEAKEVPSYRKVMGGRKKERERVPLPNHIELIKELGKDKLPCLFFHFSRHACQQKAQELARRNFFPRNSKIVEIMARKLSEAPSEVHKLASLRILKETLPQGIGFHHAGLLPVVKELVEDLFTQGLINVLYVTETFAVGINMPTKTVCFDSLRKFDGFNFRNLNSKEYFQIAGRAGRRGIDKIGYVVSMIYRPSFNYHEVKHITSKDVDPIKSQFKLSVNTVLNLIEQNTPEEIEYILRLSFFSYQKFGTKYDQVPTGVLLSRYTSIVRKLEKYQYVAEGKLTSKGHFAAKIFADEIAIGEIFATDFVENLDEYQILLLIGSLVYEGRENDQFKKVPANEQLSMVKKKISKNDYLGMEKKFLMIPQINSLILPLYEGKSFFDLLEMSTWLEGDLIRFLAQILDRIGQIKKASNDYRLVQKMNNCKGYVEKTLEGIYVV